MGLKLEEEQLPVEGGFLTERTPLSGIEESRVEKAAATYFKVLKAHCFLYLLSVKGDIKNSAKH